MTTALKFIDIVSTDPQETARKSSLQLTPNGLTVLGNLPHAYTFRPATAADAKLLSDWAAKMQQDIVADRYGLTLHDIADMMQHHDRHHAPGSESAQWGAFVDEAYRTYGVAAYDEDRARTVTVSGCFASYWIAIADDEYERAARFGDVPKEWIDEVSYLNYEAKHG